jgi:hypothetical protein
MERFVVVVGPLDALVKIHRHARSTLFEVTG